MYVSKASEYTCKEETSVKDSNGEPMWRQMGEVPAEQKRGKERYADVVAMLREGTGGALRRVLEMDPMMALTCAGNIAKCEAAMLVPNRRPDLKVYLIYGDSHAGKSTAVYDYLCYTDPLVDESGYETSTQHLLLYTKLDKQSAFATDWWDGYTQQKRVMFDEFVSSYIPLKDALRYFQGHPQSVQVKGCTTPINYNVLYITSNHPIERWYLKEQKDEDSIRNYQGLLNRIPPQNRCRAIRYVPGEPRRLTWEEYVATQQPTPVAPPQVPMPIPRQLQPPVLVLPVEPSPSPDPISTIASRLPPHLAQYKFQIQLVEMAPRDQKRNSVQFAMSSINMQDRAEMCTYVTEAATM